MAKRFLCVHQGAELYGSDRSFLQAVRSLRDGWPDARIDVLLAVDGPLGTALADVADRVRVRDLCVLRLATPVRTLGKATVAAPWYLAAAAYDMARADLVYINTIVIADFTAAARMMPGRSVIHVREIPKPRALPILRGLLRWSRAGLIFNSAATRAIFATLADQRHAVIHNGVDPMEGATAPDLPPRFTPERPLRLAMLGRISDWKGQDLLIEALGRLPAGRTAAIRLRIVGGSYRDTPQPVAALTAAIAAHGLEDSVTLEPFRDDPGGVYGWADLCIVPSRLPEPFGRVAIEAMAHGRPVIAAAHGGLIEIVTDGDSGWLVTPNDPAALARAIAAAQDDPAEIARRGAEALDRFGTHFATAIMDTALRTTIASWLPPQSARDMRRDQA
ncbi:hypothetical protein ASG37_06140 [Sphingomonas sp. Leaf407]|uniref:glycosyltransferase family 4 protein n=1 Tax=unclassified Sphingomonas TaxID=196159 RepID=UPI0006F829B6|nr:MULTISPECIES: glycosyltransferase family 4 protein [unclassified Sphingomonas]KQN34189.1 hypothetical protein ASE97_16075 [Sphingomonas sp. Leaf42]KQT30632.1 hypothetical protein ASG37_06140 [Sphingomonas sp. Leaf407]